MPARVLPIRPTEIMTAAPLAVLPKEEARLFALSIVADPVYQHNLLVAAQQRMLSPGVEQMLWAYAYGRPPEVIDVNVHDNLDTVSNAELLRRARDLAQLAASLGEDDGGAAACAEDGS